MYGGDILVYDAGISGEYDTVTATNPYGSSTKSRAVRVIDCTPATTQPVLRSVSLASFAGQTIHIAFRNRSGNTHGTVTGSAYYNTLCIDSIVVDGHADTLPAPPDTVWRTVAAASADERLGTVVGGGLVPDSSVVSLVAVPHTHDAQVVFDRWNDGDTSNPRQVFVVSDTAFTAYFSVVEDSVGIADSPFPASALRLYPNPTSGKVVVACAETIATVTLTDLAGRGYTVHFTPRGEGKYVLDLAFLPQGNYLLAVVTAEGKRHSVRLTRQ